MSTSPFWSLRVATSGSWPISTLKPSRFGRLPKKSALREKTRRWPGTHSSSLKAPDPTGFLPKSAPSASTTSFGTAEAKLRASTLRKVASGWVSVNLMVESSGVSMPARGVADDRMEKAAGGSLCFRIYGALNRVFDIRCRDFPAIDEIGFGVELEGVDQPIGRYGPTVGERRNDLGRAKLVVDKAREQAVDHRPVLPVVTDRGVESRHVVFISDDDCPSLVGRVGGLRNLRKTHAEYQRHRGALQQFPIHHLSLSFELTGRGFLDQAAAL